jgi:hypothetical protein
MFISPTKPQGDVVSPQDGIFIFAAAEFAPWLLELNKLNTELVLHQQRLHDMSYNHMSLRGGWTQAGPRQQIPHHGLPLCGTGYYSESQNAENNVSLTVG